jgi:hypothetical protein
MSNRAQILLSHIFLLSSEYDYATGQVADYNPVLNSNIVAIEAQSAAGYNLLGTGFLVSGWAAPNLHFLVTNKHVICPPRDSDTVCHEFIHVTVNATDRCVTWMDSVMKTTITAGGYKWQLEGKRLRCQIRLMVGERNLFFTDTTDPSRDLVVIPLIIPGIAYNGRDTILSSQIHLIPQSAFVTWAEIIAGQDVYMLGFPNGYGYRDLDNPERLLERNYPVLRKGCIAWIHPDSTEFWVDITSLAGNSGSPIIGNLVDYGPIKLFGANFGHPSYYRYSVRYETQQGKFEDPTAKTKDNANYARVIPAPHILRILLIASDLVDDELIYFQQSTQ